MLPQFQRHPCIVDDIFVKACNNQAVLSQCAARDIPEIHAELSQGFVSQEMFETLWCQHLQRPSEGSMDILAFSSFLQEFDKASACGHGSLKDCHLPLSNRDSHRESESRPVLLPWEYLSDVMLHWAKHDAYVRTARAHQFDAFRLLSKSERCQLLLVSTHYNPRLDKRYSCLVPWPTKGAPVPYPYLRHRLDLSHVALMLLQDHARRICMKVCRCLRAQVEVMLSLRERSHEYWMCRFLRCVLDKWTLATWTPVLHTYTLEGSILYGTVPLLPKGKYSYTRRYVVISCGRAFHRWRAETYPADALDRDIALEKECNLEEAPEEANQKRKRKCPQRYKYMRFVRCRYFPLMRKNIAFQAWKSWARHERVLASQSHQSGCHLLQTIPEETMLEHPS